MDIPFRMGRRDRATFEPVQPRQMTRVMASLTSEDTVVDAHSIAGITRDGVPFMSMIRLVATADGNGCDWSVLVSCQPCRVVAGGSIRRGREHVWHCVVGSSSGLDKHAVEAAERHFLSQIRNILAGVCQDSGVRFDVAGIPDGPGAEHSKTLIHISLRDTDGSLRIEPGVPEGDAGLARSEREETRAREMILRALMTMPRALPSAGLPAQPTQAQQGQARQVERREPQEIRYTPPRLWNRPQGVNGNETPSAPSQAPQPDVSQQTPQTAPQAAQTAPQAPQMPPAPQYPQYAPQTPYQAYPQPQYPQYATQPYPQYAPPYPQYPQPQYGQPHAEASVAGYYAQQPYPAYGQPSQAAQRMRVPYPAPQEWVREYNESQAYQRQQAADECARQQAMRERYGA